MTENEILAAIAVVAGDAFEIFQSDYPVDKSYYALDVDTLTCAIRDAAEDIVRAGDYHSDTGANIYKKAAYIGKWIAEAKPIQKIGNVPVNLTNEYHLNLLRINANFAVYVVELILGDIAMYAKLRRDLRYCFVFRPRADGDSLAMLLEHALQHSPESNQS